MVNTGNIPENLWRNEDVYILGGGFSLIEQFNVPYEVYQEVSQEQKPASCLSPYLEWLNNKRVIGINKACSLGSRIVDTVYFYDCSFYQYYQQSIDQFEGLKFSTCSRFQKNKSCGVRYVSIHRTKKTGIIVNANEICFNFSSGGAAVNLAVRMGAKRIILLAFDMCDGPNGETHWHGGYKEKQKDIRRARRANNRAVKRAMPHSRHKKPWRAVLQDTRKLNVEVFNGSYRTTIKDIPGISLSV